MAIIAKYRAVVDLPVGFLKGFTAWLVWLFIHILSIGGFRNKIKLSSMGFSLIYIVFLITHELKIKTYCTRLNLMCHFC